MSTFSYGIDFFEDKILEEAIATLLGRVHTARTKHDPYKNTIDPFAAVFEAASTGNSIDDWFPTEITRQANKTLTNALGDFHQELIGQLPGWRSTGKNKGVIDLEHEAPFGINGKPVFAEVKNKFNTMNSKSQEALYDTFQGILGWPQYKGYNCYLIQVIQKNPSGDVPWWPAKRAQRGDIRMIGAQQVYEMTTGDSDSFKKLFQATSQVLKEVHGLELDLSGETFVDDLFRRAYKAT